MIIVRVQGAAGSNLGGLKGLCDGATGHGVALQAYDDCNFQTLLEPDQQEAWFRVCWDLSASQGGCGRAGGRIRPSGVEAALPLHLIIFAICIRTKPKNDNFHLVGIQQPSLGIFPKKLLVLGGEPEAHDESEDDDAADKASVGSHCDEVSGPVRLRV